MTLIMLLKYNFITWTIAFSYFYSCTVENVIFGRIGNHKNVTSVSFLIVLAYWLCDFRYVSFSTVREIVSLEVITWPNLIRLYICFIYLLLYFSCTVLNLYLTFVISIEWYNNLIFERKIHIWISTFDCLYPPLCLEPSDRIGLHCFHCLICWLRPHI